MTAAVVFVILLLFSYVPVPAFSKASHVKDLTSTKIAFDLSCTFPELLKPYFRQLSLDRQEFSGSVLSTIMFTDSGWTNGYIDAALYWINLRRPDLNATVLYESFIGETSPFDSITKAKLREFTSELIEANIYHTEYFVGRLLFNYLRFRQSFGKARSIMRRYFPVMEAFAKVKQIREFYYKNRGFHPKDLFMLAEFVELVNWLLVQGQLPMLQSCR